MKIRGTYAHPDLIPHIATWASQKFALKVSKIVNEYFIKKELKKLEKEIREKDKTIHELNSKVDTLLVENSKMSKKLGHLFDLNKDMYDQNEDITNKLDVISNDRVVSTKNPNYENGIVVIKNNDDPADYDKGETIYEYSVSRIMKQSYKQKMAMHKASHPNMKVIMRIPYSPNSINLWLRIKQNLGKGKGKGKKIIYNGCKFNLKDGYTEKRLIRDIKKIHNERLDYDVVEV